MTIDCMTKGEGGGGEETPGALFSGWSKTQTQNARKVA